MPLARLIGIVATVLAAAALTVWLARGLTSAPSLAAPGLGAAAIAALLAAAAVRAIAGRGRREAEPRGDRRDDNDRR
jgi:hypothetical protein